MNTNTRHSVPRLLSGLLPVLVAVAQVGCVEPLKPGEFGTYRYFARVRGVAPLALTPPTTDRMGNVYVLFGAPDDPEAQVHVGEVAGGWHSDCKITRGDTHGVHGWVGHAQKKAWYWSGVALVGVSGETGGCGEILKTDPRTKVELFFKAVVPWVLDTPSKKTVVALIQSVADPVPHQVQIDLDNKLYLAARAFEPAEARNVTILGVGAHPGTGQGYVVLRYALGASTVVEGRVLDSTALTLATVPITVPGDPASLPEYSVQGFLQASDRGLVAGIDHLGRLVKFTSDGGSIEAVSSLEAVGVHRWNGELFVVGTKGGSPVIAPLDETGAVGEPIQWTASVDAAAAIASGPITVEDDRLTPRRHEVWSTPKNGIGSFPFVHPHGPDRYGGEMSGWVVAGPSYDFGGGENMTSVAFVPVGISYP